jgi:hypothetical protein
MQPPLVGRIYFHVIIFGRKIRSELAMQDPPRVCTKT